MRFIGLIFMLFPVLFMGVGGYLAYAQAQKIARAVPTPAVVESKTVRVTTDSDGDRSYRPIVKFSFAFDGQTWTADNVGPMDISSGERWANRVIDRYDIGQQVSAWVDPQDPEASFLERRASFFPYIFVLFPMIFMTLGIGMFVGTPKGPIEPTPGSAAAGTEGWFMFQPKASNQAKLRSVILMAALWDGVGVLVTAHYALVGTGFDRIGLFGLPIYFGLGMIPIGLAVYRFRVNQMLHDAVIMLDRETLQPGDQVQAYVEQTVKAGCHINALKAGLKCEQTTRERSGNKTRFVTRTLYEEEHTLAENQTVAGTDALHLGHTLTVPETAVASTVGKGYPRVVWSVTVHTDVAKAPDYKAAFPVRVVASPKGVE